tara:strand:+ start:377 stop:1828 length:1452 start_codon:yes stop_codon:yes gene_type:complete
MKLDRHQYGWFCLFAALLLNAPSLAAGTESTEPPRRSNTNIVILLVDDLGWGDVGYHDPQVVTPNIDAIATHGVELDRFYVNPTCSPTRASLLTGQFSTTHGVNGPIQWHSKEGLPLEWQTLPGYLKRAGYQTHLVGKWHLGNASTAYWPQQRGFDTFYGHLNGGVGYFDHVFSGGLDWQKDGVTLREEGYTTQLIQDAAIDLIENRSVEDEPLFLFVSFNAIHTPIEEPQGASAEHQGRATLLNMISSLDSAVGKILDSLMQQPWGKDTVIIFASDNGGSSPKPWLIEMLIPPLRDGYSSNGVLKQGKGSVFEGGIRVPAAIWWPNKLESDKPLSEVVHIADLLPTLLDFMELEVPNVDGRSLKGVLLEGSPLNPHPFVVANFGSEAMIDWPWKIVREGSLPITPEWLKSDTWYLYNIESDPSEIVDVQENFPERFERMRSNLLHMPRRESVQFSTDQSWDTFGGEETRAPWADAATRHGGN